MSFRRAVLPVLFVLLLSGAPAFGQLLEQLEKEIISVAERARPSVVMIHAKIDLPISGKRKLVVSGVVLDGKGTIATLGTAVEGATEIEIELPSGERRIARVLGIDERNNVGILQVDPTGLVPVVPAPAGVVRVGSFVLSVGNAYGLAGTVSHGIVSGLGRDVEGIVMIDGEARSVMHYDLVQTNAPINPGDSGGILVDSKGRMIGMISAAFGRSPSIHRIRQMFTEFARSIDIEKLEGMARMFGFDPEKMPAARQFLDNMRKAKEKAEKDAGRREPPGSPLGEIEAKGLPGAAFSAQGINFALPVSQVFYSARVVRAHGHAIRYGINVHMPEADAAKKAGLTPGQGLVATGIIAGGRCDRAGLKEGDILLSVAGRPVGTPKELFKCMLAAPVTGSIEILLLRDGERKTVVVSLDPM